ncbi:MAG: ornithine cyclodeaminase family protein [Clostridiaceae bacterium]|nr:ornithine cyclodeaminase family protein [Clostridiaceae bacterium]
MMYKPEILFLKQEDTIAAGLLDMKMILGVTEKTFKMIGENQIINPPKTMLGMPSNENWTSFCMSMPSYIGGDVDIAGFKWASEAVYNMTQPDMPYGVDVVILSDPKTVYPKAIMDGTIITAMRTSAAAGVAAKYLASKNSKKACLVGAGVIGRTMVMAMMEAVPSLEEIKLVDLDIAKAEAIAKEYEGKYNVIACSSTEDAAKDADIIVTETTSRKPFLKAEWVKPNATVIQMSAYEIEDEILVKADKKVVDNWAQLSHGAGALVHKLAEEGKLTEDMVSTLPQLAAGQKPGRESEDELCVCCTYGIGSVDVAVAHKLYMNALEKGIGQKLMLWDKPLWV